MPEIKERLERGNFNAPDEVREFDKGRIETLVVAGFTVTRATLEPGWKWSTCMRPLVQTDSCATAHFGYQVAGRMTIRTDDGFETTTVAGDVVSLAPGHEAWVVGNQAVVFVDFRGMVHYG